LIYSRPDSPSYREIKEYFIGERNPGLEKLPPLSYDGFQEVSIHRVLMINPATEPYSLDKLDKFRVK